MSSAGHVQTMINTMRQNRAALNSKKKKFREKKILSIEYKGSSQIIEEIAISKEEMEKIKSEIRREAKVERRIKFVKVVFFSLLTVAFILFIIKIVFF